MVHQNLFDYMSRKLSIQKSYNIHESLTNTKFSILKPLIEEK